MQLSYKKRYPHEYIQTRVERIESHQLTTSVKQRRTFDYAIIATGSRTHMFENPEREKNSYTVRYADDIHRLNEKLKDPKTKTIVVIGGGYTGVEIVATIAVRKRRDQTLLLIHGKERLFDRLSPHISDISLQRLRRHGVEVMLEKKVTDILPDHIQLASGEIIPSDMTIVSRGIRVNDESFHANLSFEESYQAKDAHHIYLCGDVAKHGLIATAHNAMFEGRRTGHLLADQLQGVTNSYPPLQNRDKLAIALGPYDGILTNGKK